MFNYKIVVNMKLIITNLYTLFVLMLCDAIVLLSVKWTISIDVIYIVLLMIGTLPFMLVSNLFDKSITFFPYYFIRLRQVDVYSAFFLYMLGFAFGTFYLWHTFWQHDGHWILGCIFGTILNWILVAMKGNDLVLVHKRMGVM